jgi:hypothetical protein
MEYAIRLYIEYAKWYAKKATPYVIGAFVFVGIGYAAAKFF